MWQRGHVESLCNVRLAGSRHDGAHHCSFPSGRWYPPPTGATAHLIPTVVQCFANYRNRLSLGTGLAFSQSERSTAVTNDMIGTIPD